MSDLFGNPVERPPSSPSMSPEERRRLRERTTNPKARASGLPGPSGEKCKTCIHAKANTMRSRKRFYKCAIAQRKATGGPGTDIRLKDPACSRHEKKEKT